MEKLTLERPIAVTDIETTGKDVDNDRIVQIAVTKIFPDLSCETNCHLIDPERPIPAEATKVHGITDEMVKGQNTFLQLAPGFLRYIEGCDLAGFNSNKFDYPLILKELLRCGCDWDYSQHRFIDVQAIFHRQEPRDLSAAVKFYLNKDHTGAHDAGDDTYMTGRVLIAQLQKYEDLPRDMSKLEIYSNYDKKKADLSGKFTIDENGDYIVNFGKKCKGEKAKDNLDFLKWMIGQDFPPDTKRLASKIITQYKR